MNIHTDCNDLDVIIPVPINNDNASAENIISDIIEQNQRYGFTRFALSSPSIGFRSEGFPSKLEFEKGANLFLQIKNQLKPYDISCGWWVTVTIKSGPSDQFVRMTKSDGNKTPFSSCPLDNNFQKHLSESIALFAQIAKPAFVLLEDDYSIHASCYEHGCYCEYHLKEFAKRTGKNYTREQLVDIFKLDTPESISLLKEWRELAKDSLVLLSKKIREEVDKSSPEIPIGLNQSGSADSDGDCTEAVSIALAGPRHTPFTRLHGTFYCGGETTRIPQVLFHALYSKQHINKNFKFYHESDTFPHTRYYSSASQMRIIMSSAYSFGFDGSVFQTQQFIDDPNEEDVYGLMFAKERKRFNALARVSRACETKGIHIGYDAFWNSFFASVSLPTCPYLISRFGLPYTSLPSSVAMLDPILAKRLDNDSILSYLSKGLFLDGDAAKILCERGFGEYLGVTVGNDIATVPFVFDLGARERIRSKFIPHSKGRNMPIGHMFACGKNGKLLKVEPTDPKCEIISDAYNFKNDYVCPTMTRFENKLGGRIVVMGLTTAGNSSQALFNYRRKRLFEELLVWCDDSFAFVKDAPDVFCIMNRAVSPEKSGFKGLLTLTNLCFDEIDSVSLHLPPDWRNNCQYYILSIDGTWEKANVSLTEDGIKINSTLSGHDSIYLLIS